jgi:hypothetical protein
MLQSNKRQLNESQTDYSTVTGKWTIQEEDYAWRLINNFETGLLGKAQVYFVWLFSNNNFVLLS